MVSVSPIRIATLVVAALGVAACAPEKTYAPAPKVNLGEVGEQQVQVHANGDWLDTGLTAKAGTAYDLFAEGRWSIGLLCGTTDAAGTGIGPLCATDPSGYGFNEGTLMGRIGNGPPFFVGDKLHLVARSSGPLMLKDYDVPGFYGDNIGYVTVTMRESVVRPPDVANKTRSLPIEKTSFPSKPVLGAFPQTPERPDDIAVIIGNADYRRQSKDIPNVEPAYADADSMRLYATEALGIRPGNVIFLRDATGAQMIRVFGSKDDPRGQLYDWSKPDSRVFVYYAGHGAPGLDGGSPYLVPSDADAARIELNGYPVKQLYDNLAKLPADHVTVVLEACFSGLSQAGSVLGKASPVYIRVKAPPTPAKLTVITAGSANQVASWEKDGSHGLFTEYFLKGRAGAADKPPYGNGDGTVSKAELASYLRGTLTYYARRYYGRDQVAQITTGTASP